MNVVLRPDGARTALSNPDVILEAQGERCGLADLDKQIRTLQAARAWLKRELDRKSGEKK